MLTNAGNVPVPPKGLKLVLIALTNFILGIPSPIGRLRPRAFMAFMGMDREIQRLSTDLKASQANNDFILAKNKAQHEQIQELAAKCQELHADLVRMSKAMKELANHPNVLGPDSQAVVNAFKIKH
jgi:hypothetical protein